MFKKKGEKEREKLGGQKDMSERRIATDLYYYYGENRLQNKSMLKTACKLYTKSSLKNMHSGDSYLAASETDPLTSGKYKILKFRRNVFLVESVREISIGYLPF